MDIDKLIGEKIRELILPLECAKQELKWIEKLKVNQQPLKLYEYEQEFLINLYTHKELYVRKARQAGLTTFYAAHIAYGILSLMNNTSITLPKFLVVCSSTSAAREFEQKVTDFLLQDARFKEKNIFSFLRKYLKCVGASNNLENYLIGCSYKEIGFDECEWSNVYDTPGIFYLADRVVCFSTPNPKQDISSLKKEMYYDEIHWYQIPRYNRNLKWVKCVNEKTIDNEGNIEYNKEHFHEMLEQGYVPTSPDYEKMLQYGINKEEIF